MFCVKVVRLSVDRFDHRRESLHVGERKVVVQHHRIERREHGGRVQLLGLAVAQDFGIALVVVVDEGDNLRILLRLLDSDIVEGSVAQVHHVAGLVVLAFVPVAFGEGVACLGEFDFALDIFFQDQPELVAQAFEVFLGVFVFGAGVAVGGGHFVEFFERNLVEQVFQEPDARDIFGSRRGPGDAHDITLVLVVGAWKIELVHELENVEVVLEHVEVMPVVLERKGVKNRLPAGTELSHRLEAAVESGIVETALACDHVSVLDGEKSALQHGFRFDLALCESVYQFVVHDAHQQDGAFLELRCQNLVHVTAGFFREVLDGCFGDHSLELAET